MNTLRVTSLCLSVLILVQVLQANPIPSQDDDTTAIQVDLNNLIADIRELVSDLNGERDDNRARNDGRAKRYIHFTLGGDHRHNNNLHARAQRWAHRARRRSRGGVVISRV